MLDEICFKFYGFIDGAIQAVFEQNPGLADLGEVYEADVRIMLPDVSEPIKRELRVWD